MRAVVQRVLSAAVEVDGTTVGEIDSPGLFVLVGVTHDDDPAVARALAAKIAGLRILAGESSALDLAAPVLVVSQFTLYADTRKGRRPSWKDAAPGPAAEPLVDEFVNALEGLGIVVATGIFGADMRIASVADGPVTLILDQAAVSR